MENYQENIDKAIPLLSNVTKLQTILRSNIQKKVRFYIYYVVIFIDYRMATNILFTFYFSTGQSV